MKRKIGIYALISIGIILGMVITSYFFFFYNNKVSIDKINNSNYNNKDDSSDKLNNSVINNEDSVNDNKDKTEFSIINIYNNVSGFCYNPNFPTSGPNKLNFIINLENISGKKIISTINMSYDFFFSDDHFTYNSEIDTGDIFNISTKCKNRTGGYCWNSYYHTYPGGLYSGCRLFCNNSNDGKYYDTVWQFSVEIFNCGNYSKYWHLGIFTEPDMGNYWNATFMVECIVKK